MSGILNLIQFFIKGEKVSKFLGPIHYWLYNKIIFQNILIEKINELDLEIEPDAVGIIESGKLEDIIDTDNIHGFLQEKINIVEKRLAFLVTEIAKKDLKIIPTVYKVAKDFAEENSPATEDFTAREGYKLLEDYLLNGMPCDRVNKITKEDEDSISWIKTAELQKIFWDEVGGDYSHYKEIRKNLIIGLLSKSNLNYIEDGETYTISEK